jgi:hypothetical protein
VISTEKPGSPEELVHFGTKGMRWGVRKSESSTNNSSNPPMSKKKKAAIGVTVAAVVVGTVATTYYLNKNGKLPLSTAAKSGGKVYKSLDDVPKKIKISEIAKANRIADREHLLKMMMTSKHATLSEATRVVNEWYPKL